MLTMSVLLLLQSAPIPTERAAVEPSFLRDLKLHQVLVEERWTSGCYDVSFGFRSPRSVKELAAQCRREGGWTVYSTRSDHEFIAWRVVGSVSQNLYLQRLRRQSGELEPYTTIGLRESVDSPSVPPRWYRGAISLKPPAPMIDVPFLPGVRTDTVSLTSVEALTSSKTVPIRRKDAAVYQVVVLKRYEQTLRKLVSWASSHGFTKSRYGGSSYFKAGAGIFEIEVRPGRRQSNDTRIVMYTGTTAAENPVTHQKR
jgi:hypothetical protein